MRALLSLAWSHNFAGDYEPAEREFKKLLQAKLDSENKAKIAFQLGVIELKRDHFKKGRAWFVQQQTAWPHPVYDRQSRFWHAEAVYLAEQKNPNLFSEQDKKKAVLAYSQNLEAKEPYKLKLSLLHRGWLRLSLHQIEEAQADFSKLQEMDESYRKDANLNQLRAGLYAKTGQYQASNRAYKQVLLSEGALYDAEEVNFMMVQNDFLRKDCRSVIERSKAMPPLRNPQRKEAYDVFVGQCAARVKDCKRALWHLREVSLKGTQAKAAFEPALQCYKQMKRYKEAALWIEKAIGVGGLAPKEKLLREKAQMHIQLAEWPLALAALDELLKVDPKAQLNPWVYLEIAKCHDQLADPKVNRRFNSKEVKKPQEHEQEALRAYEKASENLGTAQVGTQLSILEVRRSRYMERKEYDQVLALFKQALALLQSPLKKDRLILEIARFHLYQKKDEAQARKWLEKLHGMAAREVNYKASLLLAELDIQDKKLTRAAQRLSDILHDLSPGEPYYFKVRYRLGEIYQASEQWKKALKQYQAVARSKGKDPLKAKAKLSVATLTRYLKKKAGR